MIRGQDTLPPRLSRVRDRVGALVEDRWAWCLVSIAIAAAVPRFWALGSEDLWFDEAFSALVAVAPDGGIVAEMSRDSSPPLYFLLLAAWARLLGDGPAVLRALSASCGVGAVALCGILGRQLWGRGAGLAAATLLALSPLHLQYSREARPYGLLLVLVLGALVALERLKKAPASNYSAAAFCTTAAASMYTHNYGILTLVVLGAWAALGVVPARRAAVCGAAVAIAYVPWMPYLLGQLEAGAGGWLVGLWLQTPPGLALAKSLGGFAIGGETPSYVRLGTEKLPDAVHGVAYLTFALPIGLALLRTHSRSDSTIRIALGIVAFLGIPYFISLVAVPIVLVGRHDIVALPLFLLLVSRGTTRMKPVSRSAFWAAIAVLSIASQWAYWTQPTTVWGRTRAEFLVAHADSSDVVLCTGYSRNTLEYYALHIGGAPSFISFPSSFGDHRGWVDTGELGDRRRVREDAEAVVTEVEGSLERASLLWIAHARQLPDANVVLFAAIERTFVRVTCPGGGEDFGFTCWLSRETAGPGTGAASTN